MTDLETAKYYAKRRLEKEQQMSKEMAKAYLYAFSRVAKLTASSGVAPSFFSFSRYLELDGKVDKVMAKLVADLYKIIEKYAYINLDYAKAKNDTDEDIDIVGFINRPVKGIDINGRLAEYSANAKLEYEAFVAAGLLLSKPTDAVISEFETYYTNPYASPMVKSGWAEKGAKIAAIRLLTKGVSFGSGKYTASWNSIERAALGINNYGYGWADNEYMKRNGAIGYMVYRGSSYPCAICDDNARFHPITEISLPVHSRCCCYALPVYSF